jgi:hypothetical protein
LHLHSMIINQSCEAKYPICLEIRR